MTWLFITAVILTSFMVPNVSARSNPIGVVSHTATQAIIDMGRPRPMYNPRWSVVLGNQTANVLVDINSTNSIIEVTLFYVVSLNGAFAPRRIGLWDNRSLPNSTAIQMHLWSISGNTSSFYAQIPHSAFGNNTYVWGYATALDNQGNSNNTLNYYADANSLLIFSAYTPNPNSSKLELDFTLIDVDPKTLHMNLTINARLDHAEYNYGNTYLPIGYSPTIYLDSQDGPYTFSNSQKYYQVDGFGYSQLFPFDNYTYTMNFALPNYVNQSVWFGSIYSRFLVQPDMPSGGYIGRQPQFPYQAQDLSAWNSETFISFYPAHYSTQTTYLVVTILLTRQPELVKYLFLVPTFSLFTLLGLSVLLTGKEQLANRLLLYLTVFGFSYTLQPTVRSVSFLPTYFGFSMMDRILIAMIPCTVIYAAFSIIGIVASNRREWQFIFDTIGCFIVAVVLYLVAQVRLTEYFSNNPVMVTFSLFSSTGVYGWATFVALFSGLMLSWPLTRFQAKSEKIGPVVRIRIRIAILTIREFLYRVFHLGKTL